MRFLRHTLICLGFVGLQACDVPEGSDPSGLETSVLELSWEQLLPEGEAEILEQLRQGTASQEIVDLYTSPMREDQIGSFNTVPELDGQRVRMPGFLLPVEFISRGVAREFLLLPYHGACVHYPPPPPNQIVYVTSDQPIEFDRLWDPVWVEGRMQTSLASTDLAEAAYSMRADRVEDYDPEN